MRLIFIGIGIVIFIEGIIWLFFPEKVIRYLTGHVPKLRIAGAILLLISLSLIYAVIYH